MARFHFVSQQNSSNDLENDPLLHPLVRTNSKIPPTSDSGVALTVYSKLGYGLGHIHNDLCACLWFSYLLLFLTKVLLMKGSSAGGLMMFGQIVDACATSTIAFLMDKYGTKQKWHISGKFCSSYLFIKK